MSSMLGASLFCTLQNEFGTIRCATQKITLNSHIQQPLVIHVNDESPHERRAGRNVETVEDSSNVTRSNNVQETVGYSVSGRNSKRQSSTHLSQATTIADIL